MADPFRLQLKMASKLADSAQTIKIEVDYFAKTRQKSNDVRMTFLGRWRYTDFFRIYGGVFSTRFYDEDIVV